MKEIEWLLLILSILLLVLFILLFILFRRITKRKRLLKIRKNMKEKIIVTLTTSPQRIDKIKPVLSSILTQTYKVNMIILNLPYIFKRNNTSFDTIPDLVLNNLDPESKTTMGKGVSQNIGDFNSDGYNDFILNGGGMTFFLYLGGPHTSSNNPYGVRGFLEDKSTIFPYKALQVGDQLGYGRNDFIVSVLYDDINWGHILMFVGDNTEKTDVKQEKDSLNNSGNIINVFPNPFNSQTTIKYSLKNSGNVNLKLYNSIGQEIMQLRNEFETAGSHDIKFTNDKLPSGIYFLTLNIEGKTTTQKLVLTK